MKTILLTGSARGLGLAIAERLVSDGYRVIGLGRSITPEYEALIEAGAPGKANFIEYDLQNLEDIQQLVTSITKEHGPLYGLINNAGVGHDGVLATQHASEIATVLRVNLEAAIILTKYACRSMLVKRTGRIINISSIIGSTGFNGLAVYGASKAGLEGFTRSLSRELGRAKITVNCVAPGYMETDMTAGLDEGKMASVRRRAPLGLPRVEDAADAVAYLLTENAGHMTGSVMTVDGGSTA